MKRRRLDLRTAWMAIAATALLACSPRTDAAVVVVFNDSRQAVSFTVESSGAEATPYKLAPGSLVPVRASDSIELVFHDGQQETRRRLEPNTVHRFVNRPRGVGLKQIEFSGYRAPPPVHLDRREGPPEPVVIPVKILADDEQRAVRDVWEAELRKLVEHASKFIELYCGVRFEVVAVDTWESNDRRVDFPSLAADFERDVRPEPGRLAIGFTSQIKLEESKPPPHVEREPFFSHLLLPARQKAFAPGDQLELLVHELGHFLGAAHSTKPNSVMRRHLLEADPNRRRAGAIFDPANTLVLNLVADEMRLHRVRRAADLPRSTRLYMQAIYNELARRAPRDPEVSRYAELVRGPLTGEAAYVGRWVDGTWFSAQKLEPWYETGQTPKLDGKRPLWGDGPGVRWILDTRLAPPDPPKTMVEMFGGDRLPGRVVSFHSGSDSPGQRLPPYLEVVPRVTLDWPNEPPRSTTRVAAEWVRRIVWERVADRYEPATVFFHDGRRLGFRAARFRETGVSLLREDGIRDVPFVEMAELHLPQIDPWEAHFNQLAALCPEPGILWMELETDDGLKLTASERRFRAETANRHQHWMTPPWHHLVQPAWSLDPIWVQHVRVRVRRYFLPDEVPLSRIEPVRIFQHSDLGGTWPPQTDRNVEGGPLAGGGRTFAWGFGVHAFTELAFPLPPVARAFRTDLGLDRLAGPGGCVAAAVLLEGPESAPLYQSGPIVGSADVLDTGRLELDPEAGGPRQLVLRVDPAHDERPGGADPLDVRDTFDWLEPLVELDAVAVAQETFRRAPGRIPAWDGWTVTSGGEPGAVLVTFWDAGPHPPLGRFRLLVAADPSPVVVSRKLRVRRDGEQLLVAASRPPSTPAATIEVRIDGQPAGRIPVPIRRGEQQPEPATVPLQPYAGREVVVDLVQQSDTDGAVVEWTAISRTQSPQPAP